MQEITIREFHGGHRDGKQEAVGPDAEQRVSVKFGNHFSGEESVEHEYEFSHEETRTMRVTVWCYKCVATPD